MVTDDGSIASAATRGDTEAALAALRRRAPIIIKERNAGGQTRKGGGGGSGGGGADRTFGRRVMAAVGLLLVGAGGWLGWCLLLALQQWARAGGVLTLQLVRRISKWTLSARKNTPKP